MRTVILCEGSDDLWFIAYYLHKKANLVITDKKNWCELYSLPPSNPTNAYLRKQEVQYMLSPDKNEKVAVYSVGGQDNLEKGIKELQRLNEMYATSPIDAFVVFRDCDNRSPDEVVANMKTWFSNKNTDSFSLQNRTVTEIKYEIDGMDISVKILPVVIPFDEEGAVETLLLKAISDRNEEGKQVADSAHNYIDGAISNQYITTYLKKQRLVTKARFSAAIAITNPDHSTATFQQLMEATPWEKSDSVTQHMKDIMQLLSHTS